MANIYCIIQMTLNQLVYENVRVTTDLPTQRILALSQRQTFLRVFIYKMVAKINWHRYLRYGTQLGLRHCHTGTLSIVIIQ